MTNGGENKQRSAEHILSIGGMLVPLLLAINGLILALGNFPTSRYISDTTYFLIIFMWLGLALFQFMRPAKNRRVALVRLISYHLLAIAYLILVTGTATPLIALWLVLMLASYIHYGSAGLKINLLAIFVLLAIDIGTGQPEFNLEFLGDLTLVFATILTGLIAVAIIKSQQIDQAALITSQRRELLQRERTLTIVNNLTDAILSTDQKGIIKVYNAAALNLLDTNDSLNGRQIDEVLALTDQSGKKLLLSKMFEDSSGVSVRDDINFRTASDELLRLEVTHSPIRSSYNKKTKKLTGEGYIIILRDITKAKSLEEERDEFISVVSHELRTPIAIAEGTISNVQVMMNRDNVAQDILKPAVDVAHDQVMFLARMVNDLSTLSRAERGVADAVEEIDVKELAYAMYNSYREQAEAKGLHLNLDTHGKLGTIRASRLYVEELIQNFITNAIKYTHEGSITFDVKHTANNVTFLVKDTGIGISKTDQKKIFDKFYRSEDYRTRETGGTGLGLYVASKLARKLNTEIKLSSRLNHGSTFSFTLPVAEKSDK